MFINEDAFDDDFAIARVDIAPLLSPTADAAAVAATASALVAALKEIGFVIIRWWHGGVDKNLLSIKGTNGHSVRWTGGPVNPLARSVSANFSRSVGELEVFDAGNMFRAVDRMSRWSSARARPCPRSAAKSIERAYLHKATVANKYE